MALKVTEALDRGDIFQDKCCICHTPTRYWHRTDVALCKSCAALVKLSQLPTREEWLIAEKLRSDLSQKLVATYCPPGVEMGLPLSACALAEIVKRVKSVMINRGYLCKGSKEQLAQELEEFDVLLNKTVK